jgi:hypothetical protein
MEKRNLSMSGLAGIGGHTLMGTSSAVDKVLELLSTSVKIPRIGRCRHLDSAEGCWHQASGYCVEYNLAPGIIQ